MAAKQMSPELIELVAARFKALAEPTRLRLLNALRSGEKTVTELLEDAEVNQANASKHLSHLHALGFVERRKEGLYTYYRLAGEEIFQLCDIMCGRIEQELLETREALAGG